MKKSVLIIILLILLMPISLAYEEKTYIYGSDLIASKEGNNIQYYNQDYLSSNRIISNNNGNIIGKNTQEPYGSNYEEKGNKEALSNDYKFTGKEEDTDNLYYFGARYYEPGNARFISVDPVFDSSKSPYAYANNNPLKYVDPSGKQTDVPEITAPNPYAHPYDEYDTLAEIHSFNYGRPDFSSITNPIDRAVAIMSYFDESDAMNLLVVSSFVSRNPSMRIMTRRPQKALSFQASKKLLFKLEQIYESDTILQRLHRTNALSEHLDRDVLVKDARNMISEIEARGELSIKFVPEGMVQKATKTPGNFGSLRVEKGALLLEEQLLNDPKLLIGELMHEYGYFLVKKQFGSETPRLKVMLEGYHIKEMWATHALDTIGYTKALDELDNNLWNIIND